MIALSSWFIGLIIWIVCLILNIRIAQNKNRSLVVWVLLSVFFPGLR